MLRSNRRRFLGQSAVALGMTHALYAAAQPARNEKTLRLGVIGVGWYGMVDAKAALKVGGVEIAAVCDVDSSHLAAAADELKQL
ncbi:MAG: gfo/Idh/MocA family oxidoreductase, partial [Planctomycetota bacterium]